MLFLKRFITDSSKFYDEQILENENCQDIDDLIYQRTYWLTTIHQSSKRTKHNRVYKYLKKLISDSEFAKTNREFNLFYYNDCKSINDGFGNTKINDYNFDFKKTFENSFYIIFKDSKKCRLENGNFCIDLDSEYQDKIDINVFTITNILQQRMMFFNDIKISGNKMRLIESILFLMIFLEKYTSQYFRETIEEKAVYTYYKMIINDFYNFLEVNVSLVPLCQEKFTKIEKIETVYSLYDKNLFDALDISRILRVGWKKDCDLKILNQESVAEHSFSLMSLALFYLDKAKYPYKDDVMNLALLHDLIKGIYNKDINRKSSNYLKQKRNEKCTLLYLSLIGTYDNHVNLFEYFNIVYSFWDNDVSDTIRIFNDLEIIQRLIKMNYYISNKAKIKEEKINDFKKDLKMLETNFGRDLAKKFNL